MYKVNRTVEVSFVSKLVATIDTDKAIWDYYILLNTGLQKEWNKIRHLKGYDKINQAETIYELINKKYLEFMVTDNGKRCIEIFDQLLSDYSNISNMKKIDFLLWSER